MKIDLTEDFFLVSRALEKRIHNFDPVTNPCPEPKTDRISYILLGYQLNEWSLISIYFDGRSQSEPDGSWTLFQDKTSIEMDHWSKAMMSDEPVTVTQISGKTTQIDANSEDFLEIFGEMLKAVLIQARNQGLLAKLPLAPDCLMGVEELDGCFGWPPYENRRQEGSVIQK
ncbi:MAG: hypothetical protein KDC71_16530 [Acidobacteria bacterium]|nr:hypothetical protein [Acidobacteriota bacterium]